MSTETTEAAVEFIRRRLAKDLPHKTAQREIEFQMMLELLKEDVLEPVYPEACNGPHVRLLLERAQNGDKAAQEQLTVTAIAMFDSGTPLPFGLDDFVSKILRDTLPRKHRLANRNRDTKICIAVNLLVEQGFLPTRNDASHGCEPESACSIVCAALEGTGIILSEAAIEKIWQKSDNLLGALKSTATPGTIKPDTLEEWHRREHEDWISALMQVEGEVILAELGRYPNADGEWSDDDIAALHDECQKRVAPSRQQS